MYVEEEEGRKCRNAAVDVHQVMLWCTLRTLHAQSRLLLGGEGWNDGKKVCCFQRERSRSRRRRRTRRRRIRRRRRRRRRRRKIYSRLTQ